MKQTTLDLNGPVLSFATNPVGVASTGVVSGTGSGIATFTGIATASFPTGVSTGSPDAPTNQASNTGIITYRWYEVGVGALSDSQYVTGTGTTTLTLSRLITPTDNRRQFYLTADYIPSAYQSSSPVTAGTARSTGNAINEPLSSDIGTLTVYPLLEIIGQPSSTSSLINQNATITVNAGLTDNSFSNDLIYEWYLDGVPANDGQSIQYENVTVTTTTISPPQTINQVRYREVSSSSERNENRTFYSDGSVDLHPTSNNIILEVASGSGGNGGSDDRFSGGRGGAGRYGRFSYSRAGTRLDFRIGRRGNDGASNATRSGGGSGASNSCADGGRGGDASLGRGSSGGGGGGGSATCVYDSSIGRETIIAAGGSGGGGASFNVPGLDGSAAGGFNRGSINIRTRGSAGESASDDGGGGGGSGGGSLLTTDVLVPSPDGIGQGGGRTQSGRSGLDQERGGRSAEGGGATYGARDSSVASLTEAGRTHNGDGFVKIFWRFTETSSYLEPYTEQVVVPGTEVITTTTQTVPRTITLSGTKTPNLTIRADRVGINTITCKISSATAANSPLITSEVIYTTVSSADQFNLNIETIGTTSTAGTSSINLFNGEYTFTKLITGVYSFYAPDKDIPIEIDLYGGKGFDRGSYVGGEGGFSRIRFTMTRNTEYVIDGLTESINAPFLYRKGQLIACVGRGGDAGTSGNGGFGGGIGIAGASGSGRNSGSGGSVITVGSLGSNGIFGSLTTLSATSPDTKATIPNGGRTIKCTKGVYWQQQGISACSDVGTTLFRLSDGTQVTNTASITRGYKAGYNIIQTAGRSIGNGGNGGSGATGGAGGDGASGGGGGSGYTDGSVTLISNTLGGSTGDAQVIIRLAT
jgi:hypothetical protein